MIDHRYYPHIIDLFFEFAPPASLFNMSHVCGEWRRRSLPKFEHIHDFSAHSLPSPEKWYWYGDHDIAVGFRLEIDGPKFNCIIPYREKIPLLSHCRILDLNSAEVHKDNDGSIRLERIVPTAGTIRYRTNPQPPHSLPLPTAADTVVLHGALPSVFLSSSVKKVVYIDTFYDDPTRLSLWALASRFSKVGSITYIFEASSRPTAPSGFYFRSLARVFENFHRAGVPVTCVNWDGIYTATHASTLRRPEATGVRYLTLDEYRRSIGEKECAIKTDWTTNLSS